MRTIVLVLTVSNVLPPGEKLPVPTDRGKKRLDKAGELMIKHPDWELAIVGGNRPKVEDTEAHAARRYLQSKYSDIEPTYLLHAYNNTAENVRDFVGVVKKENREKDLTIIIVGHPEHGIQASLTIFKMMPGVLVTIMPAGDDHQYKVWKRNLLLIVTILDPLWTKLWSWPFLAMTRLRKKRGPGYAHDRQNAKQ